MKPAPIQGSYWQERDTIGGEEVTAFNNVTIELLFMIHWLDLHSHPHGWPLLNPVGHKAKNKNKSVKETWWEEGCLLEVGEA